jgi:hypothetical protein
MITRHGLPVGPAGKKKLVDGTGRTQLDMGIGRKPDAAWTFDSEFKYRINKN